MHGTVPKRQRNARSAISNGARLFERRIDLRTPRGKRFRDLIDAYTRDSGGDGLSEAKRAMVRDLAMLQVLSEDLQQRYMETGIMSREDETQYARITNSMRRHMKTLGLTTKMAADDDDVEDPLEYARRGGSRRRAKLDDDEEQD